MQVISRSKLEKLKNIDKGPARLTLADVLPLIKDVKRQGQEYVGTCPVCNKENHFYLREENGKLLMHCHKCEADFTTIIAALKERGALPINEVAKVEPKKKKDQKIVENYDHVYKSPSGEVQFYKKRIKYDDGSKKFSFHWKTAEGREAFTKPDNSVYLYNLDRLEAADPDQRLYIVEGEKCADVLTERGLLATTSCVGAKKEIKLTDDDRRLLDKFPDKVIIPDNDDKGMDYAKAKQWGKVKPIVLKTVWPECPEKGDIADYLAAGLPIDAIINYVWTTKITFDQACMNTLDERQILDEPVMAAIYALKSEYSRKKALNVVVIRAKELGVKKLFEETWKVYLRTQAAKAQPTDGNKTAFSNQPIQLRCGTWTATDGGIFRLATKNDGQTQYPEYASPIPVLPQEILVNVEDNTEKIRIGFCKEGSWRDFITTRADVASNTLIVKLANKGLEVNSENAKLLVRYIADCVAKSPDILPRTQSIDHLGWFNSDFLPYTGDIRLDVDNQPKSLVSSLHSKGSLDKWVDYVKPLRKNIYLRLLMAAAFASPLIEKVSALSFIFHLWGGTGTGKTAALMVAASIWGDPSPGKLVRTMNMTANSMMGIAVLLKDIPFFGDELQTIKSRFENYDTLIMRITEGIGRGRLDSQGVVQKQGVWNNAFLFTGEEPCTQSMSGGGVKNRVIEIECTSEIIGKNGNKIVNFVRSNYGTAGPAFIDAIAEEHKREDIALQYQYYFELLLDKIGTTEKQAMAMALMMLADRIAEDHIFKTGSPLQVDDVRQFVKTLAEIDVSERAFDTIMDLIAENQERFKEPYSDKQKGITYWGQFEGGAVMILKSVLEREMKDLGFSFDAVKKKWFDKGYLEKNSQEKFTWQTSLHNSKANFIRLVPPPNFDDFVK